MSLLDDVETLIGIPQNPIAEIIIMFFAGYVAINLWTYFEYIFVTLVNVARGK